MKRIFVAILMLMFATSKMFASELMQEMVQHVKNLKKLNDEAELIVEEIRRLDDQRTLEATRRKIQENPKQVKEILEQINENEIALKYRLEIIDYEVRIAKLNEKLQSEKITEMQLKPNDKKQKQLIEISIKKINDEIEILENKIEELEKSEDYEKNMGIQAKKLRYDIIQLEREKRKLARSNKEEDKKKIKAIESSINAKEFMISARKDPNPDKSEKKESYLRGENIRVRKFE